MLTDKFSKVYKVPIVMCCNNNVSLGSSYTTTHGFARLSNASDAATGRLTSDRVPLSSYTKYTANVTNDSPKI